MQQPIRTRYEPSKNCFRLLRELESEKLIAYLCPANVWTIGVGLTRYANGEKVKKGDKITQEQSNGELGYALRSVAANISKMIKKPLNQNQVDALISFVFNIGEPRFETSTVLKLINNDPHDPAIKDAMLMWKYGGDGQHNGRDDDGDGLIDEPGERQLVAGLITRHEKEAALYFMPPAVATISNEQLN